MIDYKLYNDYYQEEASQARINQVEYRNRGNKKFAFLLTLTLFTSYISFNYIQENSRPLIEHIISIVEESMTQTISNTEMITNNIVSQTTLASNMTTEEMEKVVQLVLTEMREQKHFEENTPTVISFN